MNIYCLNRGLRQNAEKCIQYGIYYSCEKICKSPEHKIRKTYKKQLNKGTQKDNTCTV